MCISPSERTCQDVSPSSDGWRQARHRLRRQDQGEAGQVRRRDGGRQTLDEPVRRDRGRGGSQDEGEEDGQRNHCRVLWTCPGSGLSILFPKLHNSSLA